MATVPESSVRTSGGCCRPWLRRRARRKRLWAVHLSASRTWRDRSATELRPNYDCGRCRSCIFLRSYAVDHESSLPSSTTRTWNMPNYVSSQVLINGLVLGALYSLIAVGFGLIYGT